MPKNKEGKHFEILDVTPIINWKSERLENSRKLIFWVPRDLKNMREFKKNV